MRIFYIASFTKLHDEEYIARSFEMLGHKVARCPARHTPSEIEAAINKFKPDIILYAKWERPKELDSCFEKLSKVGVKTVCWVFDLYWGYPREHQLFKRSFFRSDYVFTTDGGHVEDWKRANINHFCVRQGIYKDECFMSPPAKLVNNVVFVGSDSPVYQERSATMKFLSTTFNLKWVGKTDSDEVRGTALNELFAESKIVVGDSYPSPHYWSNRVVETLGRGGFLIHREVEGLKKEYPYLVTYNGTQVDLRNKIHYYLENNQLREELRLKNFEWVRDNYTCEKQCQKLLNCIS